MLKKVTAILLFALLIYNAFGYYLLFAYEREQARVGHSLSIQPVVITPPVIIPIAPASTLQAAYLSYFSPPPEFV